MATELCVYTWNIEGNKVEWCTEFPTCLIIRSPRFTINGVECWFDLTCDSTNCATNDLKVLYRIQMKQRGPKADYKPFPVTVHAGFMCDESIKFPSMKNVYYTDDQYIWFIRRYDVLRKIVKGADNRNFLKFTFVFEESPDPLPTIKKQKVEKSVQVDLFLQQNLENMSRDWGKLLRSSAHSDIRLKCKDGVLRAHKVVLAARSKVFSDFFQAYGTSSEVNICNYSVTTVNLFLEFVYCGKIRSLPKEMVGTLYLFGVAYAIDSLILENIREMCAISMISNLSHENCAEYLELAISRNDEYLRKALTECMRNNYLHSVNQSNRDEVIATLKENFGLLKI